MLLPLLLALSLPAAANPDASLAEAFQSMTFDAASCNPAALMARRFPHGTPCTVRGDFGVADLAAAAAAVYGEASMNEEEQCAVAAVIFNRAAAARSSLRAVVSAPGQFHGYHGVANRMQCDKLKASVEAVARFDQSGRCSFGAPRYRYFCSEAGFQRVAGRHRGDPEQGAIHGMSRFRSLSECGVDSRARR
jgi:spore germination cell wall hydrolase CwlJ-like protein